MDIENGVIQTEDGDQFDVDIRYWSCSSKGDVFWAATDIVDTIPPGLYRAVNLDGIGPALVKQPIATDELLDLPCENMQFILDQIENFWGLKEEFSKRGFIHKRGVLLTGDPGGGKTALVKRMINRIVEEGGLSVFASPNPNITIGALAMLRRIEKDRPVVVVLEDFEDMASRVESEWLSLMDGESQIDNCVFLATTNYPEKLDKRFTDRPSRFDVVQLIGMPSAAARRFYLAAKEPSLTEEELDEWVEASDGFSVAHLKEMIVAIRCLKMPLGDTVARLREMRDREFHSSKALKEKGMSIGFSAPTSSPRPVKKRSEWSNQISDFLPNESEVGSEVWDEAEAEFLKNLKD